MLLPPPGDSCTDACWKKRLTRWINPCRESRPQQQVLRVTTLATGISSSYSMKPEFGWSGSKPRRQARSKQQLPVVGRLAASVIISVMFSKRSFVKMGSFNVSLVAENSLKDTSFSAILRIVLSATERSVTGAVMYHATDADLQHPGFDPGTRFHGPRRSGHR